MLVDVILEGEMGKQFGREWRLSVSSVSQALELIDANKPGVYSWIRQNLNKYSHYQVLCEYEDGRVEKVAEDELHFVRVPKAIRFVPLIKGASAVGRIIAGVALVAAAFVTGGLAMSAWGALSSTMFGMGVSLALGGVVELLTRPPGRDEGVARKDRTSYLFDGPVNTQGQGVPVALIYGRVLVGSHPISAGMRVNMLMNGS